MSVVGYSVSLATLLISFVILASLRKLRCPRNLLHLHLFGSFMLRALVVLLKSSLLVEGTALPQNFHVQDGVHTFNSSSETWTCKLMICVWQYFILANYSWLLMEGLYLHSLIFMALFTDSSAITLYILLGWDVGSAPLKTPLKRRNSGKIMKTTIKHILTPASRKPSPYTGHPPIPTTPSPFTLPPPPLPSRCWPL
ncbi:secretin receptor-like [Penaeus monodon]|uniref:secretin receptor-like n=1 Tax=Penaeus monodon TaxID=6687 RepID=UPI0018A7D049|nr:secretin receptor-like [Penaeus monodon]